MKRSDYNKIFMVLMLLFLTAYFAEAEELTKRVSKSFNIKKDTKIEVSNKYGNIIIKRWDKSVFDLKVEIEAAGRNEAKTEKILEAIQIDVRDRISSGLLSVETEIGQISGNSNFSVHYEISMPATNPMKVSNSFGNIYMGSHDGDMDIVLKYGQLMAEDLKNADVRIEFSSARCEIESLSGGKLDLRYSKMEIENLGDMEIKSQFSELQIGNAGALSIDGRYGNFEIENLKSMHGDIQFSGLDIENLAGSIVLETKHGDGINLEKVSREFGKIDIEGQFSTININMENGATALLEFDLQFGNLKARGEGINFNSVIKENSSSEYSGYLGRADASCLVKVSTRYGNIRFEVN
jgi:hypothetical protein